MWRRVLVVLVALGVTALPASAQTNVRAFDGTDDTVHFAPNGSQNLLSWALLFKRGATGGANILTIDGGDFAYVALGSDDTIRTAYTGFATVNSTTTITSTSSVYLIGMNKASGTATARVHIGTWGGASWGWVHEDASGTAADGSPGSNGLDFFAYTGTSNFHNARVLAFGIDSANIFASDAAFEALGANFPAWVTAGFDSCYRFDQASTGTNIDDQCGGARNQDGITGTTVVGDSAFDFFPMTAGSPTVPKCLLLGVCDAQARMAWPMPPTVTVPVDLWPLLIGVAMLARLGASRHP